MNETPSSADPQKSPNLAVRLLLMASLTLLLLATLSETALEQRHLQTYPPRAHNLPDDRLIVPGTRVGPVVLGSELVKVQQILGEGQLRPEAEGFIHLYPDQGLILYSEQGKVLAVTVRSPEFHTRAGVTVGSDVDLVLRTMSTDYELEGDPTGGKYVLRDWENGWQAGILDQKVEYLYLTPKVMVPNSGRR